MKWLVFLVFLAGFLFLLKRVNRSGVLDIPFRWLAVVFVLKVFCGLAYVYFDLHTTYGGDSMNYFNDAEWIFDAGKKNPEAYVRILTGCGDTTAFIVDRYTYYLYTWRENDYDYFFNDSRTVVRIHAFIRLFSFGSYGAHVVVFAFLGMIGQLLLYRTFRPFCRLPSSWLFAVFFFFPSSLIWFSGILKEPLALLGTGLLVFGSMQWLQRSFSWRYLFLVVGGICLLLSVRFYMLLCLLPGLLLATWLFRRPRRVLLKTGAVFLALVGLAATFDYFAADYRFSDIMHSQLMNTVKNEEYFNPGRRVTYDGYTPHLDDILLHAPAAAARTVIAPAHRIFSNPVRALFFLENLLLLGLAIWILRAPAKLPAHAIPFIAASIVLLLLLYTLIGLTTPFEGTMIRLRSVGQPFLLFILLALAKPETFTPLTKRLFRS